MSFLILVVIVIIIGVALALRGPASTGPSRGPAAGLWCLVGGLVAALGVLMIGQATFGWVAAFDPPGWLRIVTFWVLPVGVIASAILGALSLKGNSGRVLGIAGLALAALSVGAFFAMVMSVEY